MRYETKRIGIVGFCLTAMLMVGMAPAGNASAAGALWLLCLKGSGLTKYSSSTCLTASSSGEWQSEGIKSGQTVTVKLSLAATLVLRDTKTSLGESEVQCYEKGFRGGAVLEGEGKGKITSFEVEKPKENCRGVKACEKEGIEEVKGVHLPWNIELEGNATKIANSGAGEPGWEVKCKVAGIPLTDTCESESKEYEEAVFLNEVIGGALSIRSVAGTLHPEKCTQGGAESGEDQNSDLFEVPSGAVSVDNITLFNITASKLPPKRIQAGETVKFSVTKLTPTENQKPRAFLFLPMNYEPKWEKVGVAQKTCEEMNYTTNMPCTFELKYLAAGGGILTISVTDKSYGTSIVMVAGA
jgi:hypothetical protein